MFFQQKKCVSGNMTLRTNQNPMQVIKYSHTDKLRYKSVMLTWKKTNLI